MSVQLGFVFALTIAANLIATLFFAVRIAGVRTGRLGSAVALFNILVLVMRISLSFQALLLAKHVEGNLERGGDELLFRVVLLAATAASIVGALLIPTAQRLITRAAAGLGVHRSLPRLMRHAFSVTRKEHLSSSVRWGDLRNLTSLPRASGLPLGTALLYAAANALLTVGPLASLYAGYYVPELRMTASNMSMLVNGVATILILLFTDPFLGVITDDAIQGKMPESALRRCIVLFVVAHVAGTVGAQVLLLPAARLIAYVARYV